MIDKVKTSNRPQKIIVLGGGVAAITCVFELTSQPNWQQDYDITLYQMGWRIGGKGASGCNQKLHNRIEEHGIHVWFGFYFNAFNAMRACYEALGRPADHPISGLYDAFKPHPTTAFAHRFNDNWTVWPVKGMSLPGKVGQGKNPTNVFRTIAKAITWLLDLTGHHHHGKEATATLTPWYQLDKSDRAELSPSLIKKLAHQLKRAAGRLVRLAKNVTKDKTLQVRLLVGLLKGIRFLVRELTAGHVERNIKICRFAMMMDLGLTGVIGILDDKLYSRGFGVANDMNIKDFMAKHGASELSLTGPLMDALYGGVFGYKDGDLNKGDVEAGTVLRGGLLAITCAKESFVWRMQAGMGDVVFAPYYELLKRRGVKFKFFHKVKEICAETMAQGNGISQIIIDKQVDLKNDDYQPLIDIDGLPCWPSEPLYEQIEDKQAALLQQNNVDLESEWNNWQAQHQQIILKQGQDFDTVILGISVAGLGKLCPSLLALNPAFKAMTENISTVATRAVQLWLNKDIQQLGWQHEMYRGDLPELLGFNGQPMDSWADVSYLKDKEHWPDELQVQDISYFCGVFDPEELNPDQEGIEDSNYPKRQADRVKADMIAMLNHHIGDIWTNTRAKDSDDFDWQLLVDEQNRKGEQRFDSQYWRANIDPSERYVQATTGSSRYRLKTDQSGFYNLLLTGDWIDNGFNLGCVESATISGLQTARAISGSGKSIANEDFLKEE